MAKYVSGTIVASVGLEGRGVVGRERMGTAFPHFFMFCFKMSLKLF